MPRLTMTRGTKIWLGVAMAALVALAIVLVITYGGGGGSAGGGY